MPRREGEVRLCGGQGQRFQGARQQTNGDTAMTARAKSGAPIFGNWPHHVALSAEKVRGPKNDEESPHELLAHRNLTL
jgi:hypothetical protein